MPAGGFSPLWTTVEDDYLKANYSAMPAKRIAAHLGRSHAAVVLRAGRYQLVSYQQIGTRSIRHDYFAAIDTAAKAYVLGLLAADGHIAVGRNGHRQIVLALVRKDASAVEYVRNQVAPDARLFDAQVRGIAMVRFTVQSERLAADLARLGVGPAKTYTVAWPTGLPEEFANSYVAGYFDGDGSLGLTGEAPRWSIVSASRPLLEAIQQRAFHQTGTWIGGPYADKRHKALSIVATGHGQVRDLDEWIRQDVPGLARKRLRYDQVPVDPDRSDF